MRPPIRWNFPALLLAALALAGGGAGCGRQPTDPASAAQRFFQQIAAGQTAAAYRSTAFGFQAQESEQIFVQTVKEMGLADFASGQWEAPQIKGREAKLEGKVTTKAGATRPFIVTLLEENGDWRIYALRSPRDETGRRLNHFSLVGKGSSFADALSRPIPPESVLKELALTTLIRFNAAVQVKSFDVFYEAISDAWKKQLVPNQLQRAFQPFIDKEVNMVGIRDVEAVFDEPPAINTEGLLTLSGHFPSRPYEVHFALKYVYELPNWKLFGCDIDLLQPHEPDAAK